MEVLKKRERRLFLLSMLVTFAVVTLLGGLLLSSFLNPQTVQQSASDVPKDPVFSERDSFTLLLIGYARKTPQEARFHLLSYDAPHNTLSVQTLPSDTVISELAGRRTLKEALSYSGASAVKDRLSEVLGHPIQRFLRMEEAATASLLDNLSTVQFTLPEAVEFYDQNGFLAFALPAGERLLSGENIVGILRYTNDPALQAQLIAEAVVQGLANTDFSVDVLFTLLCQLADTDLSILDLEEHREALTYAVQNPPKVA